MPKADGNYNYCDAKKVAAVWETSPYEAKSVIGNKILGQLTDLIDQHISSTGTAVPGTWIDADLSYSDAELLSTHWEYPTVDEAKSKVALRITRDGFKAFYNRFMIDLHQRWDGIDFSSEVSDDTCPGTRVRP